MLCTRLTLWGPRKLWSLDKFRGDVSVGKNPTFHVSSIWQCVSDPKVRVTVLHMGDFFIQGTKLWNIIGETFWHLESSLGTEDRIRYWHSSECHGFLYGHGENMEPSFRRADSVFTGPTVLVQMSLLFFVSSKPTGKKHTPNLSTVCLGYLA